MVTNKTPRGAGDLSSSRTPDSLLSPSPTHSHTPFPAMSPRNGGYDELDSSMEMQHHQHHDTHTEHHQHHDTHTELTHEEHFHADVDTQYEQEAHGEWSTI